MTSYVKFEKIGNSPSGKTERWEVRNTGNIQLGWISWYPSWRRYCFSPAPGMILDHNCLRDIADKCESLTKAHKEET